jgi:hypothetical protein
VALTVHAPTFPHISHLFADLALAVMLGKSRWVLAAQRPMSSVAAAEPVPPDHIIQTDVRRMGIMETIAKPMGKRMLNQLGDNQVGN